MTLFLPGMDEDDVQPASANASTARVWCDPSQYEDIVGIDFGANAVHYYMARCGKTGTVAFESFRSWITGLPCNTLAVCEWAHLGVPQTERSLAQPFTARELLDIYKSCRERGVVLKLAPHAHSGMRMRLWVSAKRPDLIKDGEKSDRTDAISLALFVRDSNEISLANPPASFLVSPARAYGRDVTSRSNIVLNAERTCDYQGRFFPLLMKLARQIHRRCGCGIKVAATVVSTLACEKDGGIFLFTHYGQIPGKSFWMRNVLRFSPWHYQGGTGRSNLMWHTFRPFLARYGARRGVLMKVGNKYKKFALMSDKEKSIRKQAARAFRQLLLKARDVCIEKAAGMNAGRVELTCATQEATDGR